MLEIGRKAIIALTQGKSLDYGRMLRNFADCANRFPNIFGVLSTTTEFQELRFEMPGVSDNFFPQTNVFGNLSVGKG